MVNRSETKALHNSKNMRLKIKALQDLLSKKNSEIKYLKRIMGNLRRLIKLYNE